MFHKISTLMSVVALTVLTACAQQPGGAGYGGTGVNLNKQTMGTVLGGVGGAVAGAQFGGGSGKLATTAIGTLLGAFIGSEVGASLDRSDAMYAQQSANYAFNTGSSGTWRNPESGNYGTITPTRSYESSGQLCREFQQTIMIDGRSERALGTACRQADGSWRIMS